MNIPAPLSLALRRNIGPLSPDAATIERFLQHTQRRRYPSRTDIFRPGDAAGTLYYVIDGSVSILAEEDDNRELILGYFGPGEFVGEMGRQHHDAFPIAHDHVAGEDRGVAAADRHVDVEGLVHGQVRGRRRAVVIGGGRPGGEEGGRGAPRRP